MKQGQPVRPILDGLCLATAIGGLEDYSVAFRVLEVPDWQTNPRVPALLCAEHGGIVVKAVFSP